MLNESMVLKPQDLNLLIELGARGSETHREDNEEVWGLISKRPLQRIV